MMIGARIRAIREEKGFSQGDLEKRTGIQRPYTSHVENGFVVPLVETLEKFARGLGVPMYRLFYDGPEPCPSRQVSAIAWSDSSAKNRAYWKRICKCCERLSELDRQLLLSVAQWMVRHRQ